MSCLRDHVQLTSHWSHPERLRLVWSRFVFIGKTWAYCMQKWHGRYFSLILSQQFMSNWSFSKTEIQEKLCKSSFPYDSTWMSPSNPRCSQRIQIQSCCGQGSIYMAKGCKNDNDGIWHNVGGRCIVKLYELRICSWQMQVSLSLSSRYEQKIINIFIRFQQKHR